MPTSSGQDTGEITLGLGTLTLNGVNVGFLKGDVRFSFARDVKDFEAGVPLMSQKRVCIRERAHLRAGLAQIYTDKLQHALGAGVIDAPTGSTDRIQFGGSSNVTNYVLDFVHNVPNSSASITVHLYRASPMIPIEIPFREEEFTVFEAEWGALADLTKSAGQQYGYILFSGFTGS